MKFIFGEALKVFNLNLFGTYAREKVEPFGRGHILLQYYSQDRTGLGLGVGYVASLSNGITFGFDAGLANSFENNDARFQFRFQMGYSFF